MTIARYFFVATLLLIGSWVTAQQPSGQLALSHNLREALLRSGFEDAIYTTGAPDLERVLTSSDFGRTPDTFVSGYYFEDELDGQGLGPLHISRFDRPSRRWVHAATITSDDRGSVMDVQIGRDYVLIEMHAS